MEDEQAMTTISSLIGTCKRESLPLPEDQYALLSDVAIALSQEKGDEESALKVLVNKYTGESGVKRKQDGGSADDEEPAKKLRVEEEEEEEESNKAVEMDDNGSAQGDDVVEVGADTLVADLPHTQLSKEVRAKRAKVPANQKLVDAFLAYGEQQLGRGHTGKGTSHLRAAKGIRDYDAEILSLSDAVNVEFVGNKMARQVKDILHTGSIRDEAPETSVSDEMAHPIPELVTAVRASAARRTENQAIVDALANFGEHELYFGNAGKGVSHLRAAREVHDADVVIRSRRDAQTLVPLIGEVIGDKIDQILAFGRIVRDASNPGFDKGSRRRSGTPAPIVQYLRSHPAANAANQMIVDALVDYGDSHLHSGHRGKGISHLRAAKEICQSTLEIASGEDAKRVAMVGDLVATKIDQILQQGHADSDEDFVEFEEDEAGGDVYKPDEEMDEEDKEDEDEDEDEDERACQQRGGERDAVRDFGDFGHRELDLHSAPIIRDLRGVPAEVERNQELVDALTDYADIQLSKRHTGRGITFARAARQVRDVDVEVTSGAAAKSIGMIGDKVAAFIDEALGKTGGGGDAP